MHPAFPDAARQMVCNLANWRTRLSANNRVFSDLARFHLITQFLFLHYASKSDGMEIGVTFGGLCELSAAGQKMGPRAIRTTLKLMMAAGLITVAKSPRDLRLRIYEPTPKLLDVSRSYFEAVFCIFDAFFPHLGICARLRAEPEFAAVILGRLGRAYLQAGSGMFREAGPFLRLLLYDGANPIVAVIVHCYWSAQPLPTGYELAMRFKVSQTQVRAVLGAAARLGLLTIGPRGRVQDVAPLAQAYTQVYCSYLAFYGRYGLELEDRAFRPAGEPVAG